MSSLTPVISGWLVIVGPMLVQRGLRVTELKLRENVAMQRGTGELLLRSPYVAVGYWRRPAETAAACTVPNDSAIREISLMLLVGGCGDSAATFDYSTASVERARRWRKVVGGAADLIGWSDGGIIALQVAMLIGLVLCAAALRAAIARRLGETRGAGEERMAQLAQARLGDGAEGAQRRALRPNRRLRHLIRRDRGVLLDAQLELDLCQLVQLTVELAQLVLGVPADRLADLDVLTLHV